MQSGILWSIILGVDLLATSFIVGATIWFFFVQSPALHRAMVREQFVPVQMKLARLLFSSVLAMQLVVALASLADGPSLVSLSSTTAFAALILGALNKFAIFPAALRAGAASHQSHESRGEKGSPMEFVSDGAGKSATVMHRVVVVFVLLMTLAIAVHGYALVRHLLS